MEVIRHKSFLILFCIFSSYFSTQPILPEAIATATLLKCGGVAAAVAVGGRYVTTATKEISELYQMHFRKVPQAEFYNNFSNHDQAKDNIQASVVNAKPEKSLFAKMKDMLISKQEQQHQGQAFQADGTQGLSDDRKIHWSQTWVHSAQQVRGFFPRVNHYHYYSDKGDFWKGATVGSFVTGTTCCYINAKHKKDYVVIKA
jgi:hypothetical protein